MPMTLEQKRASWTAFAAGAIANSDPERDIEIFKFADEMLFRLEIEYCRWEKIETKNIDPLYTKEKLIAINAEAFRRHEAYSEADE